MNITKYRGNEGEFQFYYGKAAIKENFIIASADEQFYRLIGRKSGFSIPEILHEDDVDEFLRAVECMDIEPQCLLVRLLTDKDTYCVVYMKMSYNGKILSGFRSFDIEITDVMSITDRYKLCFDQMEKYRLMMSLHNGVFLEYSYNDDMLQIYEYFNGHSRRIFYKNLTQTMEDVIKNERLSAKQKEEVISLGEMIHKRIDSFKTSFDAEVLIDYMQGVRLECSCAIFRKEDSAYKLVGLVHYVGNNQPEKSYYLSENAKDAATGILNKRAIHEYALERIQFGGKGGYLVLIDIDDFKQINDKYGHMFGDEVIMKTAEILCSAVYSHGMVGRFGGDEFMLVLENVPTEEDMRRIMKVITKRADCAFSEKDGFKMSFSCGISKFPEDGNTYEELFRKADGCLYIAKDKGKSRYIIYREEMHGALLENSNLKRSVGLKATISDADKHILLSNMILKLHREGKEAIQDIMKDMQTYFDIDGIAIYTGVDMHRTYSCGNYVNPIQSLSFIFEPAYFAQFDASDCYVESVISHLEKRSPIAYRMNVRQETGKFIQYILKKDGRPEVVVSFDFFNRSPKFGVTDNGIMRTIGMLLAEVAMEQ